MVRLCIPAAVCCLIPGLLALASWAALPPQYESPHIRPLAVAGDRILAVNTPDCRLSVFLRQQGAAVLESEIRVGMEPVSVAVLDSTRAWVVNHLSDDISVVDYRSGVLLATVQTGDEPAGLVFLPDPGGGPGDRLAAVTESQENRVVFLRTEYPFEQVAAVSIPGEDPRALAADPDGAGLWVAVFESGNQTTLVPRTLLAQGPWGGFPPLDPPLAPGLPPIPTLGVLVREYGSLWLDEQGGDWTAQVTWDLPDNDLVHIDLSGGTPQVDRTVQGVGTLLYDLVPDPATQDVWVVGIEARNEIYFEPKLLGIGVENRITRIAGGTGAPVSYSLNPEQSGARDGGRPNPGEILALPNEVLLSSISGPAELYVTSIGGDHVAVVDPASGTVVRRLPCPEGMTGIAEAPGGVLLAAVNRLENALYFIDPETGVDGPALPLGASGFDPTPQAYRDGRRFLYTGSRSRFGSFACASCHPDAHLDGLSWDLGDPTGMMQEIPPEQNGGIEIPLLHPVKGPMLTQSLRGLAEVGPLHWRGDRADFTRFNPAFSTLMGGDTLTTAEMRDFEEFILALRYPPNPWRDHLDQPTGQLPNGGDPVLGEQIYQDPEQGNCTGCHALPLGTSGLIVPQQDLFVGDQPMKIPQMRGLHEKLGFESFDSQENTRGFGFFHDGFDPDLWEFLEHQEERLSPDQIPHLVAYLLSFPTETHGGTGRQVTVDAAFGQDPERQLLLSRLLESVESGGVDLMAHGTMPEGERGWLWVSPAGGGQFQSDRQGEIWSQADLVAAASGGDFILTYTAVPLGQGIRMGLDRDGDGVLDRTEIDLGSDPADPGSLPPSGLDPESPGPAGALTRITALSPNPSRGRVSMEFYLGRSGEYRLALYSVDGRLVRSLASGELPAGAHGQAWDGTDAAGRAVPAGIYWARLESGRALHSRRMVRY